MKKMLFIDGGCVLRNPLTVYLLMVVILLIATPARLVVAQQPPDLDELERVATTELRETSTPGAAIAVVSGARAVFLKGLGVASIETNLPVTPDTLFYSGGLSSLFTSTALVSLVEERKLDLNSPIGRYVGGLSQKLDRLTAHQLLTSTAGLREEHLRHGLIDDAALGHLVRSWRDDRVFAEPGRIYSSSHLSFALAGLLLEEVARKPFADAVSEHVFAPLGMSHSTYRPLLAVTYPFSQGHERTPDGKLRTYRPFAGNSVGLPRNSFYSVGDAARFLIAFLNGGSLEGKQVLPKAVVARLLQPYVPSPARDGEEEGYGLLHFSTYAGHRMLSLSTSWGGLNTLVRIVPDKRFAFILITNRSTQLNRTAEKVMQLFLSPPAQTVSPAGNFRPVTGAEAGRYVGTYENERRLRLFVKGDQLYVRDESQRTDLGNVTNNGELPVSKVGERDFIATGSGGTPTLRFRGIEEAGGKVKYLHFGSRALPRK